MIDEYGYKIDKYDLDELKMLLEYYKNRKAIDFGSEKADEVMHLTSGIPSEVLRFCRYY